MPWRVCCGAPSSSRTQGPLWAWLWAAPHRYWPVSNQLGRGVGEPGGLQGSCSIRVERQPVPGWMCQPAASPPTPLPDQLGPGLLGQSVPPRWPGRVYTRLGPTHGEGPVGLLSPLSEAALGGCPEPGTQAGEPPVGRGWALSSGGPLRGPQHPGHRWHLWG